MLMLHRILLGFCLSLLYSLFALASPASTDYVKASIEGLRADIMAQLAIQKTEILRMNTKVEDLTTIKTHHIGDIIQGGRVFWVDESLQHGLVVSLAALNQGQGLMWRNGEGGDRTVNAKATGFGAGEKNTQLIVAQQTIDDQEGLFAALAATNYQIDYDGVTPCHAEALCYSGWYLPSLYELMLLHHHLKLSHLKPLSNTRYWSSSESSTTEAWAVDFTTGEALLQDKGQLASILAIHSF